MDRRRSILNHLMETWRSIKCKLLGILFKLFKEVSTMIFWGAGGAHKKNRQLWSGFVCPLILAHYNAQSCPHTVELLTNLREFHSARRRGEGPQYGPSRFFLGLLGAFSGLLGAFSGILGPSGTFWDLLGPSPIFLGSSQGFSCLLRAISGRRVPLRALWNFSKLSLTALVLVPSHPWQQQPYQPHAGVLGLRYSTAEHWLILDSLIVDSKKWLRRRLVVIFGQFFFIKTVWCHLSQFIT